MSCERDDEQQRLLASLQRRAAAGQIDRRGFLQLAAAIGLNRLSPWHWPIGRWRGPSFKAGAGATSRLPMTILSSVPALPAAP